MALSSTAALWFLPFVLPICLFVAFNDMRSMKIPNVAVAALMLVFIIVGLLVLPFQVFLWQLLNFVVILLIGFGMNVIGAVGAGDAKFAAAAAPFVAIGDLRLVLFLFAACLLGGFVAHRIAKYSPLRKLVPDWESWQAGKRFPMGLPLAGTLLFYLILAAFVQAPVAS